MECSGDSCTFKPKPKPKPKKTEELIPTNAELSEIISENPVVVFSLTACVFCSKVKAILDKVSAKYTVIELDKMDTNKAFYMHTALIKATGRTSLPAIFIGGIFIGGYNDGGLGGIETLYKSGKLIELLENVKSI